jgi:hypothetical protein
MAQNRAAGNYTLTWNHLIPSHGYTLILEGEWDGAYFSTVQRVRTRHPSLAPILETAVGASHAKVVPTGTISGGWMALQIAFTVPTTAAGYCHAMLTPMGAL